MSFYDWFAIIVVFGGLAALFPACFALRRVLNRRKQKEKADGN